MRKDRKMKTLPFVMLTGMVMILSACVVPYHDNGRGYGHGHYKKQGHYGHPGNSAFGHSQGNGRGPHR